MKPNVRVIVFLALVALLGGTAYFLKDSIFEGAFAPAPSQELTGLSKAYLEDKHIPYSIVAKNLSSPWELQFLPDGDMLVTEQVGRLTRIHTKDKNQPTDTIQTSIPIPHIAAVGNTGLRGLEIHPNFKENHRIYVMYSIDDGAEYPNIIMSFELKDDKLINPFTILEGIKGSKYNNGGRLAFGPDNYLYVTTGDALQPQLAQNLGSLNGKILRITADGSAIEGNPFQSRIFSYGHRNPEGLTWTDNGILWSTEHGRDQDTYGLDEVNVIFASNNYGWPAIEGDKTRADMKTPVLNSGPSISWDPSSAEFAYGSLFFSSLSGENLYEAKLSKDRTKITKLVSHFKNDFGRIRRVRLGPDGNLYLLTDNSKHPNGKKPTNGSTFDANDVIIKIDKSAFE